MREKIGALIQFLAVVISFGMIVYGVCGAYNTYFKAEEVEMAAAVAQSIVLLIIAVVGLGIGVVGVVVGNLMKR